MDVVKIDDHTIGITKVVPETRTPVKYDYDFLIKQRDAIQAQKDRDNAQRDIELAEVEALIAECEKLGIKSKEVVQ
jgi:hypothetical protein